MSHAAVVGRVAGVVGAAGHLFGLFLYAVSGLLAPFWGVAVLIGVWLALSAVGVRLWRERPVLLILLPAVDIVIWVAVMSAGEAYFNWTA